MQRTMMQGSSRNSALKAAIAILVLLALDLPLARAESPTPPPASVKKDYESAAFNGLASYAKSKFKKLEGNTRVGKGGPAYSWKIASRPRFLLFGKVDQVVVASGNKDGGVSEKRFDILQKRGEPGHLMLKERTLRKYAKASLPLGESVEYRAGLGKAPTRRTLDGRAEANGRWLSVQLHKVGNLFKRR
jgi:hypothetical protein